MGVEAALIGAGAGLLAANEDRKTARSSIRSAERQRDASQAFIREQIAQGREDLFRLFSASQDSRRLGVNAGLDLVRQNFPQQLGAFQQGNVGAQQTLINALPQIQNAILGRPVDLNMQPVQLGGELIIPQLPAAGPMAPALGAPDNPLNAAIPVNTGE